jgi:hypothetical protein
MQGSPFNYRIEPIVVQWPLLTKNRAYHPALGEQARQEARKLHGAGSRKHNGNNFDSIKLPY